MLKTSGIEYLWMVKKIFYATDTGNLDGIEAQKYDLYMVEANYTDEELAERIKTKEQNEEFVYEYEVKNNHLSQEQTDQFILENSGEKQRIRLLARTQVRRTMDNGEFIQCLKWLNKHNGQHEEDDYEYKIANQILALYESKTEEG